MKTAVVAFAVFFLKACFDSFRRIVYMLLGRAQIKKRFRF